MERSIFSEEHTIFRSSFSKFVDREIKPHQARWAENGSVSREVWRAAGSQGFVCTGLDARYGGAGASFLYSAIVCEELAKAHESGFGLCLHSDIVVPYIAAYGSEEQKAKYLSRCASGECITAIAMTEPGAGSDLAAIKTTAERDPVSGEWVLSGSKTFVSNGTLCDLVVVAAKTDPRAKNPQRGLSLFLVEAEAAGFARGKPIRKLGMAGQDTCEMFFEDCRLPASSLLGNAGAGMMMMMERLQQERLIVAIAAHARAEQVLRETIAYAKQRTAFGRPIASYQNTAFKLAECATKLEVGRPFLDRLIEGVAEGRTLVNECSMAKLWFTETFGEIADVCLQFWGGYGLTLDSSVARAYQDARVQRIYAGTNEIMKLIIATHLGLPTA